MPVIKMAFIGPTIHPHAESSSKGNAATAKFTDPDTVEASYAFLQHQAWIDGFLSAVNMTVKNGKADVVGTMSGNDLLRWIGAWCRDNMSENVQAAILHLLLKIDNNAFQRAFPN